VSNIFLRKKKDGTYRMILNLKEYNKSIEKHHFKMDTLLSAINLVRQNCYMASVDLRDAYYTIPISKDYQQYLRFLWEGKLYQYTCLPNGLSSAPRYFTKILKPVYSNLRTQGESIEECRKNIEHTVNLFEKLGFIIHNEKSLLEPVQQITFLIFVSNCVTMMVSLTLEKVEKVQAVCDNLAHTGEAHT
jgi:hypothetical protein